METAANPLFGTACYTSRCSTTTYWVTPSLIPASHRTMMKNFSNYCTSLPSQLSTEHRDYLLSCGIESVCVELAVNVSPSSLCFFINRFPHERELKDLIWIIEQISVDYVNVHLRRFIMFVLYARPTTTRENLSWSCVSAWCPA